MEKKSLLDPYGRTPGHGLSVEPTFFFFMVTLSMSETTFSNFLLFENCQAPNLVESKCDTELDSEAATSQLQTIITVISGPLAVLVTSCAGSLIDRNLKFLRWFLLQPVMFQLVFDVTSFACAAHVDCSAIFLTIYSIVLRGIGGVSVAAMLFSVAYVSHTSTDENRLVRIGRVLFANLLGQSVGTLIAGYVVEWFGFSRGFLICVGLGCLSLLSNVIFVEDLSERGTFVDEGTSKESDMGSVIGGFKILVRKRKHNKRKMLILLVVVSILYKSVTAGTASIDYLFLRNKFGWEAAQYGVFLFYLLCVSGLGTLVSTEIFKRRLHFLDTTNAIIASCSFIVYITWWSIVFESWQVYLAPILGMFNTVTDLVSMSMASKCVEREEYGRLSSLCALSQIILPLAVLFTNVVYQRTLRLYPAAVFFCFIPLTVGILIIYGSLLVYMKKLPPTTNSSLNNI